MNKTYLYTLQSFLTITYYCYNCARCYYLHCC